MHTAIKIEGVSKKFRRSNTTTIKGYLLRELWKKGEKEKSGLVWALKDVSLRVKRGATYGIIGQNGSGKSTLLKIMAGILKPDAGEVSIDGKLGALIELGAGFHPDFTGRENIYINGMLLGLTKKEIRKKIDGIIEFAGLEDFIDEPVRTYSSGMYSKLGFSVAVNVDPDILLIDEVFAVGDEEFVHKCKGKMDEFKRRGKTILFVTHSLDTVEQWCDEAMWIEYGVTRDAGKSMDVTNAYKREIFEIESRVLTKRTEAANESLDNETGEGRGESGTEAEVERAFAGSRWGSREVEITSVKLFDSNGSERYAYRTGESMKVRIHYKSQGCVDKPVFGFAIVRSDGVRCYGSNTMIERIPIAAVEGEGFVSIAIDRISLLGGQYFMDAAVHTAERFVYDCHNNMHQFIIMSDKDDIGIARLTHRWEFSGQAGVFGKAPVDLEV
ncbi:MAG: ABC transporter ATP-binding protein [Deltaproteobacteria bacterium]|nr:ABC transporter ATP-binding protein [Deltaproteobacteria bacterium]